MVQSGKYSRAMDHKLSTVDHVVYLENGEIKVEGSWEKVKALSREMKKFIFSHSSPDEAHIDSTDITQARANHDAEEDLEKQAGDFCYMVGFNLP
ncbi:hypothetical protein jhhlp_005807 [Lomentospora prolificans]|uniref:Uncharacterized protein n=1 Tax=Lomentospora prolificans TaxID=41688 RepID=A0A2N3N446_9PEZI|nr:hypothetical protein jhhlp_005807 [Lomentospora prolificans]